jgi:uncharacterized membrane protein YdjX (TVP38/TMEM64 family)
MDVKTKTAIKVFILTLIMFGLLWINHRYLNVSPSAIREWILSFGAWAPIMYVIFYTLRPLILFPASIVSLSAGLAFGALFGTIFTLIGATAGAVLSFWVSRKLGGDMVKKEWKGKAQVLQEQLEQRGFIYILLLRLIPVFNFDLISYLAGVSKVRFGSFFFGTLIGIVPGTFAYNFLGSSFVESDMKTIGFAILLFLAVLIIPLWIRKKYFQTLGAPEEK